MKSFLRIFFITLFVFGVTTLFAQESAEKDHPGWLVVSQQMVDMENMSKVNKMIDSVFAPVLEIAYPLIFTVSSAFDGGSDFSKTGSRRPCPFVTGAPAGTLAVRSLRPLRL